MASDSKSLDNKIEQAKLFLEFGWMPIPIKGKVPVLSNWQFTTKDNAIPNITKGFIQRKANNLGIVTGKLSNVVVVDVDRRENGMENWKAFAEKNGIPLTFTVLTGSGALHVYYQYDERMSSLHNGLIKGKGIDFKTDAGQVVTPGSIHPETKEIYKIIDNGAYTAEQKPIIARMPNWLFDLIQANQK